MMVPLPVRARLLAGLTVTTLTIGPSIVAPSHGAQRPAPECHEWQECRQLALDARARGQYERFHDLAWRTVQTGPVNDPALMYLLARAQSLSNRPRDALLMLRRLANRGVVTGAKTEEDLDAVRRLPGWPEVEALIERVAQAGPAAAVAALAVAASTPAVSAPTPGTPAVAASTSAVSALTPGAPPAVPAAAPARPNALRFEPRPGEEVARFSAEPFVAGGLAYDAVSHRFLFGDVLGRRVIVLGENSDTTVDLVRAASARFQDVTSFEIDPKRGDLWVASTARNGDTGAIHRLQLISGRALEIIESRTDVQTVRLIDLAIAANGMILVLDGAAARVSGLRSGAKTLEQLMSLDVAAPSSITAAGNEHAAYVAHRDGIVRLDLTRQSAAPVTAPEEIALGGFERIRWHRNALVGVQALPDGSRRVVRLQLNGGRAVTVATVLEPSLSTDAGPTFATISGDDLYYLVTQQGDSPTPSGTGVMNVVVKRIRLP